MWIEHAKRLRTMPANVVAVVLTDEKGRRLGEIQKLPDGRFSPRAYTSAGTLAGLDPVSWRRAVQYVAA